MREFIDNIKERILANGAISYEEAVKLMKINIKDEESLSILYEAANQVRKVFKGNKADLCSIMNVQSGSCTEDCKYCAQSIHYSTGVEEYALLRYESILERALEMEKEGVQRFSLVTSGRGIEGEAFENLLDIYSRLKKDTKVKLCASHGIISYEQAVQLKNAGVSTYHHNLESSARFFQEICSTHTYEDRIQTIRNVQLAGLELCSGGIMGMGETMEDRLDMVFQLKELGIKSLPVNILNPIKGTPLENQGALSPTEILKIMAVYRLILPEGFIRYAGGRMALGEAQSQGLRAGVNAALVGNYLTTVGNNIAQDKEMLEREGFQI